MTINNIVNNIHSIKTYTRGQNIIVIINKNNIVGVDNTISIILSHQLY